MSVWRWAGAVAHVEEELRVTLGEGETPLIRTARIGRSAGLGRLFVKLESSNPTGSYKDRFAALAVSHMRASGKRRCVATSSGNTGSALAAYCAAAGLDCEIAIVEGTPEGKLSQMLAYGAKLYQVRGFGPHPDLTRRAFEAVQKLGAAPDAALQISAFACSPAGMSGVQTIGYELAQQAAEIGGRIDHVFCPAGGGGLTLAVARGFERLCAQGKLKSGPAIHCVQPVGNNTIAGPLREGAAKARAVTCTSQISGLQVGTVLDGDEVIASCRASGGTGHLVEDEAIWEVQGRLAREEGIFCEPAGATAMAGALAAGSAGEIDRDLTIVCLVTGSGFKDPSSVTKMIRGSCPMIDVEELEERGKDQTRERI